MTHDVSCSLSSSDTRDVQGQRQGPVDRLEIDQNYISNERHALLALATLTLR
jgi:hypothetical protein